MPLTEVTRGMFKNNLTFARKLDSADPLKSFRSKFSMPKGRIYFTGNSLGLQPKNVKTFIEEELKDWAELGVEGHFHAKRPWLYYHKFAKKSLARLVGAKPEEVVAMNQLTVNLHLMLTSFYRPTASRFKIITEAGAFSSDQYAIESQIRLHGLDPDAALVEVAPRAGEFNIRTDDIINIIRHHGGQVALVLFGGVQYYSGQHFQISAITKAAHDVGAYAAFDLAHAIGNVPLALHDEEVDFAVWCSYKYLNSGPGGVAGAFVHEKYFRSKDLPRLAGWWGYDEATRFKMMKGFVPMEGVDGWQVSNFPVLSGAAHLASLEIFNKVNLVQYHKKRIALTGFAEFILNEIDPGGDYFRVITPATGRGCQLSILMRANGLKVFRKLTNAGVVVDWREPDVIRIAPVPLYNTFEEVWKFGQVLRRSLGL